MTIKTKHSKETVVRGSSLKTGGYYTSPTVLSKIYRDNDTFSDPVNLGADSIRFNIGEMLGGTANTPEEEPRRPPAFTQSSLLQSKLVFYTTIGVFFLVCMKYLTVKNK